ncbi:MAG: low-specificity L-threonine aldolase [Chloroflexota bacterium]
MDIVDLRSDTVTHPTSEMREAMAHAEVGDDVYGEDPTINRLEALAADKMGKEAGLFVPSGTMGNLAAVLAHCNRGDEVILGTLAHTFLYEAGGISALGGVHPHTVPNQPDGTMRLEDVKAALRPEDAHFPISRLVILENTHNCCGGVALTQEYTQAVADLAHAHGMYLHLDGARIFNAAVALGVSAESLSSPADSVTFCLSKGLCAPVGSVLCGSKEFVLRARRVRKQLGGGMRQAGVLAAAGIVALEQMIDRLGEDHSLAKTLADKLVEIDGICIPQPPQTNMVYLTIADTVPATAEDVKLRLLEYGIRVGVVSMRSFRLVTHYWVNLEGIERTVEAFRTVLDNLYQEKTVRH